MIRALFILILVLFSREGFAGETPDGDAQALIEGVALVRIKSRHFNMEFEQAVRISETHSVFAGLDDFGGEMFRIVFDPVGMRINRILSMPLSQQEFLDIMSYRVTAGFAVQDGGGEAVWTHLKNKKLKVVFKGIMTPPGQRPFPREINIEYKKSFLNVKWMKVEVN